MSQFFEWIAILFQIGWIGLTYFLLFAALVILTSRASVTTILRRYKFTFVDFLSLASQSVLPIFTLALWPVFSNNPLGLAFAASSVILPVVTLITNLQYIIFKSHQYIITISENPNELFITAALSRELKQQGVYVDLVRVVDQKAVGTLFKYTVVVNARTIFNH